MIKALFFDAGDTLIRLQPSAFQIFKTILEEHHILADKENLQKGYDAAQRFYKDFFLSNVKKVGGMSRLTEKDRRAIWIRYNSLILETLGVEENREMLASVINDRFEERVNFAKFQGVENFLVRLEGYTLGVISNWNLNVTLESVFRGLGLADYFSFLIASCEAGYDKPHPEIFRIALRKASVEPHEAIHVGDSYEADVMGARGAGITPILLDRMNRTDSCGCIKISNLDEILKHLT